MITVTHVHWQNIHYPETNFIRQLQLHCTHQNTNVTLVHITRDVKRIHTTTVTYLTNKLIQAKASSINISEASLTKVQRHTLSQNKSPFLPSYFHHTYRRSMLHTIHPHSIGTDFYELLHINIFFILKVYKWSFILRNK